MKNPFIIRFKKQLHEANKVDVIDIYIANIKGTHYEKIIRVNDHNIIIKAKFYSFNPVVHSPINIWVGFCGKAELFATEENTIEYSINYTNGMIYLLLILLFFNIPLFLLSFNIQFFVGPLALVISIFILQLIINIIRHKLIFNKSIRMENRCVGNYNWEEIFAGKSDDELKNIAEGNSNLTLEVEKIAKEVLSTRTALKKSNK